MSSSNEILKDPQSAGFPSKSADQPAHVLEQFKGITFFPSELLLEIVSDFRGSSAAHPEELNTIRALSQTCKRLRSVYLPLLWKRVDASITVGRSAWHIQVGHALERKSQGLIQSDYLASYVQVIVVTLTRYQTATILPAFAQCLSILPNLHTIEIAHAHSKMMSHLKSAFEGKKFPTVRTVSLPSCAHAILRCCPAVENVTCTSGDGGTLISALAAAKCNKLTKVSGITPNTFMANRLAKAAPNLSSISIRANLETIKSFTVMKNLSTLEIEFPLTQSSASQKNERQVFIDAAQTVMRGNKYTGDKLIKIKLIKCDEVLLPEVHYEMRTETEVIVV